MAGPVGGDLLDTPAAGPAAIRGGAQRMLAHVAGVVLGLGSAALLFRHLGVADSGRYLTVQSIVLIAAGVTDAGLSAIAVREYAVLAPSQREALLRDLLGLRLALSAAGIAAAVLFTLVAGYGTTLALGAAVTGLATLVLTVQHQLATGLVVEMRQGWVAAAEVVRHVATTLTVVILVVAGASLLPFFWANVVGAAAAAALIVGVTRATTPMRPAWNLGRWRALAAETLTFAVATAVGAIYVRLAMVLVSLTTSDEQTGYYGVAFRAVEVIVAVPVLLAGAAYPILARAARDDPRRLDYALGKLVDVLAICGAGVALALATGAPFLVELVAGDGFEPAADVLRVLGVGVALTFVTAALVYAALSVRSHRELLQANLAALVACGALVPVLAATHDAVGAAVGMVVCEAVLLAGLARTVRRAGVAVAVDPPALARVGVALGLALLPWLLPVSSALHLLLCGAVYVLALLALRALPEELREHLPQRLR